MFINSLVSLLRPNDQRVGMKDVARQMLAEVSTTA
jgi:hypothetical protein